uniref:AV1-BRO-18 protein n=1 Tax=Spodoptera frugiperda ascovirus 1a TaxID=113370 RepID=Q8JJX3_SFAVA|nr:AV1-BRO-18 protein [Spodoptera frugiperda ascovirus 1a]
MAVVKVQFNDQELKVISVKDEAGQLWMLANPFALMLNYNRPNDAIRNHVSNGNKKNFDSLHKFITTSSSLQVSGVSNNYTIIFSH